MKVLSHPWHKISMAVCLMLIAFMMPACAKSIKKTPITKTGIQT